MKTHKLLELQSLLKEYAAGTGGTRQLMAASLAKAVDEEARAKERLAEIEERCDLS